MYKTVHVCINNCKFLHNCNEFNKHQYKPKKIKTKQKFNKKPEMWSPKLLGSRTPNAQAPKIVELPTPIPHPDFCWTPNSLTLKPQKSPNSQLPIPLRLHISVNTVKNYLKIVKTFYFNQGQ